MEPAVRVYAYPLAGKFLYVFGFAGGVLVSVKSVLWIMWRFALLLAAFGGGGLTYHIGLITGSKPVIPMLRDEQGLGMRQAALVMAMEKGGAPMQARN